MKTCTGRGGIGRTAWSVLTITLLAAAWSAPAAADELEDLLSEVPEAYATAYAAPFISAHGPNQNSNLFSTARIPRTGLVFGFGIKAMGTRINDDDQTFRRVIEDVDLGAYDPALAGQTGTVIMEGPTMFGDTEEEGTLTLFASGVEVYRRSTISGVLETTFVPLAVPEFYVGGVAGLKAVVRWFPDIGVEDIGTFKLFGWGLQWSAAEFLNPDFPVDLMAGYFKQGLDVTGVIETEASSFHVVASRDLSPLTVYGGFAWESSSMDVAYTFVDPDGLIPDVDVAFTADGVQDNRFTLGANLDFLMNLNVEMAHGKFTTYSAGLMFGL